MSKLVAFPKAEPLRAIVTGAAEGIGAACARALADSGVRVAVADIDKVPLARLAKDIGAHAFCCDVLSEVSVNQLIEQSLAALGGAELVVNAAGKGYVRALGMMRVSRAFVAAATDAMVIVNVPAGTTNIEQFGYAGSRPAFRRLSDGLGRTFGDRGITVVTADELGDEAAVGELMAQLCQAARFAAIGGEARQAGA